MITVHYRGPLSSCNYTCGYCPFAKEWEEPDVLAADAEGLQRFVGWAQALDRPLSVLFTPWGEALVRKWYRDALVALSWAGPVRRVAAQTNLSMALDWLADANREALALWTTWHPSQAPMERFVAQTRRLDALGVRYSVGVVGLREHLDDIERLRAALPPHVTVWVNAYKRVAEYYSDVERSRIGAIDPRFGDNREYPSKGRPCFAGETHLSVDERGDARRCHFVEEHLGNLYTDGLDRILAPRTCPNDTCRCHIGYVHLKELGLYDVYGEGLLERIPREPRTA
jgi:MoaA/NifB/PqqE/SkfB family radical SAM enzyme